VSGVRLIIGLGFLLLALPLAAMNAAAHSPLLASNPADGAVVDAAPGVIELNFRDTARLIRFRLVGPDGSEIGLGKDHLMVSAQRHNITLPRIGAGRYTARWRAMGEDGHVLKGGFSFRVGGQQP